MKVSVCRSGIHRQNCCSSARPCTGPGLRRSRYHLKMAPTVATRSSSRTTFSTKENRGLWWERTYAEPSAVAKPRSPRR